MSRIHVVEGWTGPLDFQLESTDAGFDLVGKTVELVLKEPGVGSVDTTGDVSILDAAARKVRYSPDPTDLVAGKRLTIHWKVTDGAGKVVYFPNGAPDELVVNAE